jgi:cytochrome c oxidase subunit 2
MRARLWIVVGLILLALAVFGSRYYEVDLPIWRYFAGEGAGVDPLTLHLEGEFVESNLGVAEEPNQPLTVRLIAQQYLFVPECVEVPAGVPVRFRVTSADVVHSLAIAGTSFQLKAVPGAVNEAQYEFTTAGEHAMPCHEFCGAGHYAMRARVVVVPRDQFAKRKPGERGSCGPR